MPDESLETREKLLRESVVSLAKGQQFDGQLICRLQAELADLKHQNAHLAKLVEDFYTVSTRCESLAGRRMCPSRLAIMHVGARDIVYEHCVGRVGHDGQHQTADGTYF